MTRVLRTATTQPVRDVAVGLAFERGAFDLVVSVDDAPVPAEAIGASPLFTLPGRDGVRRIDVGQRLADDRVRLVQRFDVVVQGATLTVRGGR